MKFLFTMNMPSNTGKSVHQVVADHAAESLGELLDAMANNDMMLVRQTNYINENWQDRGDMILNTMHIGKVQVYVEPRRDNRDFRD